MILVSDKNNKIMNKKQLETINEYLQEHQLTFQDKRLAEQAYNLLLKNKADINVLLNIYYINKNNQKEQVIHID